MGLFSFFCWWKLVASIDELIVEYALNNGTVVVVSQWLIAEQAGDVSLRSDMSSRGMLNFMCQLFRRICDS